MSGKSKAKVLFVTNLYPSDEEPNRGVYIRNQAVALEKSGYEICVLQMDYRSIRRKRKLGINWRKQDDIWVCHFSVPISPFTAVQYALAGRLTEIGIKLIEDRFGKFDLIHGHFLEGAYGLIDIKHKKSIPIVFTEHGSNLLDKNRSNIENQWMKRLYAAVDQMIVVGHRQYVCAESFSIDSLSVIPNVIPDYFKYDATIEENKNIFLFVSVGNLIESKCFALLIDAFEKIYKERKNMRLEIVGKGPLEGGLKKKVNERGLSECISFTGAVPNRKLADLYNKADCFVLPSRFETFGVVYAEALCTGTPIISTKNGGIDDIYEDGCGYLVEVDNEDELEDAMKRIMFDAFDHQAIAEKYQSKFGESNFVQQIEKVYEEALNGGRK